MANLIPPLGSINNMTPWTAALTGSEKIPFVLANVTANYTLTTAQIQTWLQSQIWPVSAGGTGAATAAAHLVFAGPASGAAAAPSFRQLGLSEFSGTITYTQIQNESPLTLLGNFSGVSAAPSEISLGTGLTNSGNVLQVSSPFLNPLVAALIYG